MNSLIEIKKGLFVRHTQSKMIGLFLGSTDFPKKILSKILKIEEDLNRIKKYINLDKRIDIDENKTSNQKETNREIKKKLRNNIRTLESEIINKMRKNAGYSIKNSNDQKTIIDIDDLKEDFLKDKCKIINGINPICPKGYVDLRLKKSKDNQKIFNKDKNKKKNIKDSIKCCPKGFKIKLSGTEVIKGTPEYLNKFSSKATLDDKKEWDNFKKKIDMPDGFFL